MGKGLSHMWQVEHFSVRTDSDMLGRTKAWSHVTCHSAVRIRLSLQPAKALSRVTCGGFDLLDPRVFDHVTLLCEDLVARTPRFV